MEITPKNITIKELTSGYSNKQDEGVNTMNGKLNVRPAYQREFVYKEKQRNAVIETVMKGFPINVMYWAKSEITKGWEVMDGQQRTISICEYVAGNFSINGQYYFNLPSDIKKKIDDYELSIYECVGSASEVLDWFKVINIAGEKLTDQELRNVSYVGPWLSSAKTYFSKRNCAASLYQHGNYVSGNPIRQELLETALRWITDNDENKSIEDYMGKHARDDNASELWSYFTKVLDWAHRLFPVERKELKSVDWGHFYNRYKDTFKNPYELEPKVKELMMDDEVTKKSGIYPYLITGKEKYLSLRGFSDSDKRKKYEEQDGKCAHCHKLFKFEEMEGDHIKPWSKGGKTEYLNLQMLCADCNREKSDH